MCGVNVTALLASFPSPDRGVWHLGPVPLRAYALCIIVGIVVAIWWADRRFVARGGAPGTVVDIAVYAVPFGLIGGRLYHVLTDWSKYFGEGGDPAAAFKIWQGGLGIWGAISLGALGAWIGARRKGVPLTAVADAAAPGIVVAQGIGRIGNWFNQELFGRQTSLPWGLEIYRRVDPVTGEQDTLTGIADGGPPIQIVHPTFLYELLWNFAVAALVVWADRRWKLGRGRAFALYVAGYTAGRFWIELLRVDPATMVSGVRINVITSVVVFLAAVIYLLLVRGPREILAGAPGTAPAGTTPADGDAADTATDGTASDASDGDGAHVGAASADTAADDPAASERSGTAETRPAGERPVAEAEAGERPVSAAEPGSADERSAAAAGPAGERPVAEDGPARGAEAADVQPVVDQPPAAADQPNGGKRPDTTDDAEATASDGRPRPAS